jgi:DNA-binding NtrC family response regulator
MDEVGDLPLPMQVKLLRVLEEGAIQPVGGKVKQVNVRIVAASNKDLNQLVREGRFREDLFYRIVQAQIYLSPLRDRGSDILLLARCFLSDYSTKNRSDKRFSDKAEKKLLTYRFPGNVRQLQNIVKLAYIHSDADVIEDRDIILADASDNALNVDIPSNGIDLDNEVIPAYYRAALKSAKGNASEAARLLGLKPHTFRARLRTLSEGKYYNQ